MAKTDGSRIILFVDDGNGNWVTLAYATELELDVTADTVAKASTSAGGWRQTKKRRKGWTVSVKHLMADVRQRVDIEALIESRSTVNVLIAMVATGGFEYADVTPAEAIVSGAAHFTRMSITAQRGSMCVMSVGLTGHGELAAAS